MADLKKRLFFCLACFLLSRLLVLGVAYTTFYSFSEPPAPSWYADAKQGRPLDRKSLNALYFYDATHYMKIADQGYTLPETPWYPLYPLLIRVFGGTPAAAVALSNILFLVGLLALYRLGGKKAVVLACVSPIAIVFSAIYSESLFFLHCRLVPCLSQRKEDPRSGSVVRSGGIVPIPRVGTCRGIGMGQGDT
jgi:hypothetical protein